MNDDDTSSPGCNRRDLLRGAGAAALGLTFLPFATRSTAAPGMTARARRLLILNLSGGVRSSAAFNASTLTPYNPYGMMAPTAIPPFALGRILDDTAPGTGPLPDADYIMGANWQNVQIPRLREIATQFSVLGTYSTDRGDHLRARIEEPTGTISGGDAGILTRIAAAFDELSIALPAPPFHVQPAALFGNGVGAMTKYAPVSLAGYYSLPSAGAVDTNALRRTGNGYAATPEMRDAFDQARMSSRHGVTKLLTSTFSLHRNAARVIGARLGRPDMAVANQSPMIRSEALGTVTLPGGNVPLDNGMLYDLFTRCLGPFGDTYRTAAINAALAIRLLQLDSPAVTLEIGNFDFHSGERTSGPGLYSMLGRVWAALRWLLPRVPDPSGDGSLFDRTLVVTMSDFGRDKGGPSGWNGGEGSDHGADFACFYLAHAVMGAGTRPNKLVGPVDTNTYNAAGAPVRYNSRQLLVTLLDALGLDAHSESYGLPTGGDPIGELWT
jgi:hypothetical protein